MAIGLSRKSVALASDDTADAAIAGLHAEIAKMRVGPGTDSGNDMGTLICSSTSRK